MLVVSSPIRSRLAAAVAIPAMLLLPTSSLVAPGVTYTFKSSTETIEPNGKTKTQVGMVGRGQVAGSNARIEIVESKAPQGQQFGKGAYFLMTGGGATMTVVDPKEKAYYEMDLEGMMRMVGAVGQMIKMDVKDVKIDVEPIGAGETIEGYATQKYRMVQSYTMSVSVIGMKQTSTINDTTTYWFSPQLQLVGNPFTSTTGLANAAGSMFNNPDYSRQMNAAMAKLSKGVPLKMVSRNASTDGKGKTTINVTTMEVTDIKRGDIPSSVFEIPSGYTKMESPTLTAAQMDSLQAAQAQMKQAQQGGATGESDGAVGDPTGVTDAAKQGAKDGAQEAAREGAKAATKKKIGKIFGRP